MGVNFNSPTVVKADSPGEDLRWLTGALAVKAWMRMESERPLALLLEMETQYPVPGRRPVTVKAGALVLVVLAVKINYIMGWVITRIIRVYVLPEIRVLHVIEFPFLE